MVLRKPAAYAEMLEMLIEEVNDRLSAEGHGVEDWQIYLLCKSLTVKRIILDKKKPQMDYFLKFHMFYMQE
jgi:hypothetical protein